MQVLYVLDEIVMGGMVLETNLPDIMEALIAQDRLTKVRVFSSANSPYWRILVLFCRSSPTLLSCLGGNPSCGYQGGVFQSWTAINDSFSNKRELTSTKHTVNRSWHRNS